MSLSDSQGSSVYSHQWKLTTNDNWPAAASFRFVAFDYLITLATDWPAPVPVTSKKETSTPTLEVDIAGGISVSLVNGGGSACVDPYYNPNPYA
jgi:hypothetical protein